MDSDKQNNLVRPVRRRPRRQPSATLPPGGASGGTDRSEKTGTGRRGATNAAGPLPLPENGTVVVVGGGPAGSFFAIQLLRRSRAAGRSITVIIIEKKSEICFYSPLPFCSREGCNYCAGGLSPRLIDGLRAENIVVPDEVIESRPTEVIVHGDWKSIQLPVPEGREMLSVFRGSRPRQRTGRYANFDTFLLHLAADEGAQVITAEVNDVRYSAAGKPLISYRTATAAEGEPADTIEADLAVFAGGVNRSPGMDVRDDPVLTALQRMIPRLRPPKVRKAVIAEMTGREDRVRMIDGELHLVQYGSKDLHVEMASVMPKKGWLTTVLLGKSVDRAQHSASLDLVDRFLQLPNVQRLVPHGSELQGPVLLQAEHDRRGGQEPRRCPGGADRRPGRGPAVQGRRVLSASPRRIGAGRLCPQPRHRPEELWRGTTGRRSASFMPTTGTAASSFCSAVMSSRTRP